MQDDTNLASVGVARVRPCSVERSKRLALQNDWTKPRLRLNCYTRRRVCPPSWRPVQRGLRRGGTREVPNLLAY